MRALLKIDSSTLLHTATTQILLDIRVVVALSVGVVYNPCLFG